MKRMAWAVLAAAGVAFAVPVQADDPEEASPTPPPATALQEDVRSGAGSMEPADGDTPEDRSEREFVENVWNSP
jgi:hypothetical protein